MELILQEVSTEREIEIPEPVRDVFKLWRPSPLFRAHRLEKALGTPAKIYYKYEGVSPAGSHKPNTAVPQAFYNAQEGIKKLTTETGAGQWGSLAGLRRRAVRLDVRSPGARQLRPEALPPRADGNLRRALRRQPQQRDQQRPRHPGQTPTTPARWASPSARRSRWPPSTTTPSTRSARCSTTCCCTRPSSARRPCCSWKMAGDDPDVIVGCTGGGSNFAGIAFPFIGQQAARRARSRASSRSSPPPAPA
jgi:tryptophan synthase beta chain